jgi:hypothetical protein
MDKIIDVYAADRDPATASQISAFVSEMLQGEPTPTASSVVASVSKSVPISPRTLQQTSH